MERYLRKADASAASTGSSDASLAHTTFDLGAWAGDLSHSQDGLARVEDRASARNGPLSVVTTTDDDDRTSGFPPGASQPGPHPRRSSLPRPKAACLPTPASSARRSVTSGQSATAKPSADGRTSASGKTQHNGGAPPSRPAPRTTGPQVLAAPQASAPAAQKSETAHTVSPGSQRASPGRRKGRSGLPCLRGSSPPTQSRRGAGGPPDASGLDPEKRPSQPPRAEEEHAADFGQSSVPAAQYAFSESPL